MAPAFDEMTGWIGLWTPSGEGADFYLSELVRFETTTLVLSDFTKLSVIYAPFRRINGPATRDHRQNQDFRLSGTYFEAFQEIAHNLLANAFKYSGLNMSTPIEFDLIADGDDLVVRCSNFFSDAHTASILERYPSVVAALKTSSFENAEMEGLSGFKKIRMVCSRVLGCDVSIRVAQPSAKKRRYVVEVRLPLIAPKVLISDTRAADRG